jgi:hypothetical protein
MIFYRVFISYATGDIRLADYVDAAIKQACPWADVFIAKYHVPAGVDLAFNVYSALIEADVVVLLWTPISAVSDWVRSEGECSFLLGKYLIQVKTEKSITISRTLRTLKYEPAYRYPSVKACLDHVALQVAAHCHNISFSKKLIAEARHTRYSLSREDDAFYRFAIKALKDENQDAVFISGSPVTVLPLEADTNARKEYLLLLRSRFMRRGELGIGKYIFNKSRTFRRLIEHQGEASRLPAHLRFMKPLLESSNFCLCASTHLDFFPSGLVTPKGGAIVLKDPSDPDRTVGVYFIKGKQLANVIRTLRLVVHPSQIETQEQWLPQLQQQVSNAQRKE